VLDVVAAAAAAVVAVAADSRREWLPRLASRAVMRRASV